MASGLAPVSWTSAMTYSIDPTTHVQVVALGPQSQTLDFEKAKEKSCLVAVEVCFPEYLQVVPLYYTTILWVT